MGHHEIGTPLGRLVDDRRDRIDREQHARDRLRRIAE